MSDYLTVSEAARMLGVSEKTIRRRVKDGTLASERFGGLLRVRGTDDTEITKKNRVKVAEGLPTENIIYFIRAGEETKIGVASNLERRMRALQTASPVELECIHAIPNAPGLESALHVAFKPWHLRGEWFALPHMWREWTQDIAARFS